jgi:hypothetical protein
MNILIGKRFNSDVLLSSALATSPFQHTCNIYYALQSRYTDTSSYKVKNLPLWMSFHESNGTFTMYPDHVTGSNPYSIELYCCNTINECAVNTF